MRPLDGVDAVDLNEAEPLDQLQQIGAARRTGRLFAQRMPVEKQPPRVAVRESE